MASTPPEQGDRQPSLSLSLSQTGEFPASTTTSKVHEPGCCGVEDLVDRLAAGTDDRSSRPFAVAALALRAATFMLRGFLAIVLDDPLHFHFHCFR